MNIEIKHRDQLTDPERQELGQLLAQAFGTENDGTYDWAETDWHVLVRQDGHLVSQIDLVERIGTVDGAPAHLGGIGGVATHPDWRRQGYAAAALAAAVSFLHHQVGAELGLLVCGQEMVEYYSRFGWEVSAGPMFCDTPRGKEVFAGITMLLPLGRQSLPRGAIDLCGLPW